MNAGRASDTWQQGDAYERYVGRWSRRVAPAFLDWLDATPGLRWLDVGCGTGALTEAILDRADPASVVGVEPSEGFLATARELVGERAAFLVGSAEAIPQADASADVVVSGLVLNFVPDARAAVAEMLRVTSPGGTIAAYVWDYAGRMELMRYFWDAAAELDPESPDEGARFPLCDPLALEELFSGPRFAAAGVSAIDVPTPFASFDDYWQPFLGGQGPGPAYVMSLRDDAKAELRERLRARLPIRADGSIPLIARAWAVRASVAP
jgi:SAM-dependent methyltransferase